MKTEPQPLKVSGPRYGSVATVHHFHARDVFLLADYYAPRCSRYFDVTFGMSRDSGSNSIQFSEYRNGAIVRQRVLVKGQWGSFFPRYVQLIACFTFFALRHLPRSTWILTPHPPILMFEPLLRLMKKLRFVMLIADIFDYNSTSLLGRLFNRYVRHCAENARFVLYLSSDIQQRHDLPGSRKPTGQVRRLWRLGIRKRFTDADVRDRALRVPQLGRVVLGYVGIVRSCVGLENLIECVRRDESLHLDIVGGGDYAAELRHVCGRDNLGRRVTFRGYLPTDSLLELSKDWFCGTMLYDMDQTLYTRYTEPGKAKIYLSLGLPIMMTDVSYIVDEVRQHKAGVVLSGNDPAQVGDAISGMKTDYAQYAEGAAAMAKAYDYERKYAEDFAFMEG
jgi:glycosyltransferase involved in cell wall biosynthesis